MRNGVPTTIQLSLGFSDNYRWLDFVDYLALGLIRFVKHGDEDLR